MPSTDDPPPTPRQLLADAKLHLAGLRGGAGPLRPEFDRLALAVAILAEALEAHLEQEHGENDALDDD